MPEFFQTYMGKKFYEADVPRLIKALERIANLLQKSAPSPNLVCGVCYSDIKGMPGGYNANQHALCRDCAETSQDPLLKRVKILVQTDDPNTTWELVDAPAGVVVSCDIGPALTDFPET